MNKSSEERNRRWPWNIDQDEENYIEPYDETEDVRNKSDEFEDW